MNFFSSYSRCIGKIVSIQDSIITCDEPYSNCLIGELVCFNNNINSKVIHSIPLLFQITFFNSNKKRTLYSSSKRSYSSSDKKKHNSPLAARLSRYLKRARNGIFLLVSQLWSCADKIRLLVLIILKGVVGTNLEYRHVYRFAVSILLPTTTSTGST